MAEEYEPNPLVPILDRIERLDQLRATLVRVLQQLRDLDRVARGTITAAAKEELRQGAEQVTSKVAELKLDGDVILDGLLRAFEQNCSFAASRTSADYNGYSAVSLGYTAATASLPHIITFVDLERAQATLYVTSRLFNPDTSGLVIADIDSELTALDKNRAKNDKPQP